MAVFSYQAVTSQGETRSGIITAVSEQEAVAQIQTMGLMVMSVTSGTTGSAANEPRLGLVRRKSIKHADIVDFTRQLAVLIGAGLPLDRTLEIVRSVCRLPPLQTLVGDIQESVRGGDSLSMAMASFPQYFSNFYINFVRSSEHSGDLAGSLQDLSNHMEKAQALKEQLKSALIYPIILVVVTAISLAVIFTYVLPEFSRMFADMNAELPASTAFILGTAKLFNQYAWLFFALLVVVLLYIKKKSQDEAWRLAWDTRVLSLPLAGDLVAKVEMARLSRSLGTLLRGGVPLLAALAIARDSLQNRLLAARLAEATGSLQEGAGLAEPLLATGVFPEFALQMIQVGEETGQLDKMLLKVADIYDAEVATATQRMLSVLEPVMILGLAVVIGGIVISILSAIMGINQMPV